MHSVPHLPICSFCGDINFSSAGLQTSQWFIYCLSAYLSHLQESPDTSTHCYHGGHNTGQILPALPSSYSLFVLQLHSLYHPALPYVMLVKETRRRSEIHVVSKVRHFFSNHIMFSSSISVPLEALKSRFSSVSKFMDVLPYSICKC